jgi:hypothetical protein
MPQHTQLVVNNLVGKRDLFLPERGFGKKSIFTLHFAASGREYYI